MGLASLRMRRIVTIAAASGAALAWVGCSVFGADGDPPSSSGDAGDTTADSRAADGGGGSFGPARVIVRHAPGLRGLAVDSKNVYFANEAAGEILAAPKAGTDAKPPAVMATGYRPSDVGVDATRLYWIDGVRSGNLAESVIFRSIAKTGGDPINAMNYAVSSRMTIAAGHVYTTTSRTPYAVLMRDGAELVNFGILGLPRCVVSNGVDVFYEHEGKLDKYPKPDGGAPLAQADVLDIAVDEQTLYWITATGAVQAIRVADPGAGPITLATALSGAARIAVDGDGVFVTAWGLGPDTGKLVRIPKQGGPAIDLATGLAEPWAIAIDGSGVYVANHGDGTVVVVPR